MGETDAERRTALNIIGPHWDGNQVWFILGGGAIFAAFPTLYATSFSTFYVVMILLLFSMILRPVAFEYRSKVDATRWRETWDWAFLVSGALPMIIYGAAFGNVLQGVGFHFDLGRAVPTRTNPSSGTCSIRSRSSAGCSRSRSRSSRRGRC